MAPGTSLRSIRLFLLGVAMLAAVAAVDAACGPGGSPGGGGSQAPTLSPVVASVSPTGPSPSAAGRDAPPDASLAAEGGDPVIGQLGTYVWLDTGSDSPWLPGAPLAVGASEPLTISLDPDGEIEAWTARFVPAGAQGPAGARTLGEGAGRPAFQAPEAGIWTVEVLLRFGPAAGEASYFWQLQVE